MSNFFEGIIVMQPSSTIAPDLLADKGNAKFAVDMLRPGISVIFVTNPRREGSYATAARQVAIEASLLCGKALLVLYDSRIGLRGSEYYEGGQLLQSFGGTDELFVPTDERGYPKKEHPPLRGADLSVDEEYETIINAVQLGLQRMAAPDLWHDVLGLAGGT